jgi:molecular chaperone DnaK (HSP70)
MEAGAEHPGARGLTATSRERVIGIDLGTTNSALAWADPRGPIRIHDVAQLVAPGEVGRVSTLPSFLYFPTDAERDAGAARLPWQAAPDAVVGVLARDHGALVPARQVASAKSWLSNALVDRMAPLLPWGTDAGPRLSPVDASARVLAHLRDAWNHEHARPGAPRLEAMPIVLTVPASFDEEARELTVQAARDAGFERLTLLEEPLAALYAWIAAHRRSAAVSSFAHGARILVCDVGGGTTDFSLIRVSADDGDVAFERIAIGEHLLLGGDNLDLALAVQIEHKFGAPSPLTLSQRQTLRRKCGAAKEQLLSDPALERLTITILGAGRSVVGGGLSADLTREEVTAALLDGFLPLTDLDDVPARDRRTGLRELGLPFESEPAITRHLAAFLTRTSGSADAVAPDAVLFNGGFFAPALARDRTVEAIERWFGRRPSVLENARPEAAVALGAAFYGRLKQDPAASRRLLIRAGSARAYYVGVSADDRQGITAVCVLPRGTEEGTRLALEREFTVIANQPAAFTLYSALDRGDAIGDLVTFAGEMEVQRHAPLATALRFGKRSRRVPLNVRLSTAFTETGTLEVWCESTATEHRWRLAFNLRALEGDGLDEAVEDSAAGDHAVVIEDDAVARAERLVRDVFGEGGRSSAPEALAGDLENALGHNKHAWPLDTIRRLADVLLDVAVGRAASAAHEVRWLNLTGFCVRPGFGSAADGWRVTELRKVYAAGLHFPKEVQNQVEWLVFLQRISGGFNGGQQRELAHRTAGQLGIGQRKGPRLNPQIERESWRLLGGLERLDGPYRARLGDDLVDRLKREPRNAAWLWAIGRFGARVPLYGPLNAVVVPDVAERWMERLLSLKQITPDAAGAVVHIGARTGDPARDVPLAVGESARERLIQAGLDAGALEPLRTVVPPDRADAGRVFGESLPEGLRLV